MPTASHPKAEASTFKCSFATFLTPLSSAQELQSSRGFAFDIKMSVKEWVASA